MDENFIFCCLLRTNSGLGTYSNCLVIPRKEPTLVSGSFIFGALGKRLVVGFLSGIVPTT
jgi:hypothetical protein